ncbi:hypothetical protein [Leisingera methylohalidivorans]|uniref:Uncharacterized protein n=1 Tax=Leisingera methylohalidivorans DSM 14336 TaxID=999552 RepID=V9VZ29_9RHOB|nr:hypothetical protein METH_09005 [Leisingera methylohalidivorans DSM 14336]
MISRNKPLPLIARHLHAALRMELLIREFRKRIVAPGGTVIGDPVCRGTSDPLCKHTKAMMDFLRKATYELSAVPLEPDALGFECEKKHCV